MQHTPRQRTIRFIFFSLGFVLFVLMIARASQQVSDPHAIAGRPYRVNVSPAPGALVSRQLSTGEIQNQASPIELATAVTPQPSTANQPPQTDEDQGNKDNTKQESAKGQSAVGKTRHAVHASSDDLSGAL